MLRITNTKDVKIACSRSAPTCTWAKRISWCQCGPCRPCSERRCNCAGPPVSGPEGSLRENGFEPPERESVEVKSSFTVSQLTEQSSVTSVNLAAVSIKCTIWVRRGGLWSSTLILTTWALSRPYLSEGVAWCKAAEGYRNLNPIIEEQGVVVSLLAEIENKVSMWVPGHEEALHLQQQQSLDQFRYLSDEFFCRQAPQPLDFDILPPRPVPGATWRCKIPSHTYRWSHNQINCKFGWRSMWHVWKWSEET